MRFPKFMHWSEGQFLQQHHFQQLQRALYNQIYQERSLYTPYPEGLISINVDTDALRSRRVFINSLCAVMPDGVGLSMPGNIEIEPITIDLDLNKLNDLVTVYLAVPYYSNEYSNIAKDDAHDFARFKISEESLVDENTGDNETVVIKRMLNAKLVTDPSKVSSASVLPILKLKWVTIADHEPYLEVVEKYTPPYFVLDNHVNIFNLTLELVYELKACKSKILSDIEQEGFDPNLVSGTSVMRLMQLELLNKYIVSLQAQCIPQRVTPFTLYLELSKFLASLHALYPLSDQSEEISYDHYDLYNVFSKLLSAIRQLINAHGKASAIEIDFNFDSAINCLAAPISNENLAKGRDFYIALQGNNDWKSLCSDIETGDNFRLLDKGSKDSRVRGVKLSYVRFPPRYLPVLGSDTVYFKVMKEESARLWRYVVEDHMMILDYAPSLFKEFNAKLFIAVVDEENEE